MIQSSFGTRPLRDGQQYDDLPLTTSTVLAARFWRLSVAAFVAATLSSAASPSLAQNEAAAGLADFQRGAFAEAYQEWRAGAAAGDARAALFIGVLFDTGEGVVADPVYALSWYRKAAEMGSPPGAFNVAIMYDAGRGTPQSPAQAVRWYLIASGRGYARADYNLGLIYEAGAAGVPRDPRRAELFFRHAAARGVSAAQVHLAAPGKRFSRPSHASEDPAMVDFSQAQQMLLNRGALAAADAAEMFRRAAERNNALAEYDLGYCYEHGIGVPRDLARAVTLYKRAAAHATDQTLRNIALTGEQTLERQAAPGADERP